MYSDINMNEMKEYILNKFKVEGDFDFLDEDTLKEMIDSMLAFDEEYMKSAGVDEGEIYDEDDAYDKIFASMQEKYPDHKMYCMRLSEDYLDFVEEYLASVDAIDWE